ncbi:MAG: DUF3575 domain-containing protein [Flavobacteriaceae bacterium]|jgi:hypothetical protein|nr:DUF3575 domain-containing protein [Flavobacteriaceae bacterium]
MKKPLLFFILIFSSLFAQAQEEEENASETRNFIKTNITSIALNNYSFQYERVLSKRTSLSLSYRFMPQGEVPFKDFIADQFDEEEDVEYDVLNSLNVGNYAITPEFRFYMGKGHGRGFYLSAYYRYAAFDLDSYPVTFVKDDGSEGNVSMDGKITSHSGGIMLGVQWSLGRHIVLDWWIVGAHIGSAKGVLNGYSQEDLSILEQQDIKESIEDFEFFDKVTVTDNHNVKVDISGPWAGLRTGLSLGIRF